MHVEPSPSSSSESVQHQSAIEVSCLDFSYGSTLVLENVTFSVNENFIFGLLGPNGGGKTTLFRILCTLYSPDRGAVRVAGLDVRENQSEVRRKIGVVFQSNSLDVELTVEENLFAQGHLHGFRGSKLAERISSLLDRFGLQNQRKDRVRTLSGGLCRRLELAKGLLHQPQILLLDEPTVGLDPAARQEFWRYLSLLREREHITILVTTHLMEEAERCDRLVILDKGLVVASGRPLDLKEKIGGDVIVIQTSQPRVLREKIEAKFQLTPTIIGGTVRIELQQGHEFISKLMENCSDWIEAITVGKPTLEDVFIHETGHRFWSAEDQ
jgi:ABC-2 type transport system ATP-binding protein